MAAANTNNELIEILSQTLSTDANARKTAERLLSDASKRPRHHIDVLQLIASMDGNNTNPAIRQAAAVHFKNIVKKGWDADAEDGTDGIVISDEERGLIKSHLVELMCTVPPQIKSQFSEAISLIAAIDFPQKWDNLLNDLIQKFNSPDPNIVSGVLLTANSILKRFRYKVRSDDLYTDLAYVLQRLQAPLLTLFKTIGAAIDSYANDAAQLKPRFDSLRSICRIFYSLNWQDLPEYFEDHMNEWMTEFAKYLNYKNPLLVDEDEEDPIDKLQAAIINNLYLYADKDEEPFIPFLSDFTSLVWNLLMNTSKEAKHDILATTCIKFLSSLVGKPMHKGLFQSKETLTQIISNIVIPNLLIRDVDEEQFEDDPAEFILSDMEESDTESRRKQSQILLRAMCRQFEEETTAICLECIQKMLSEFSSSNGEMWISKDAAIHLMLGISIRAGSLYGVSAVNDRVDVMQFFTSHILTELQDTNHSARPMVKASAIKFAWTFRNQFTKAHIASLMPLLISHLSSPSVVVHTYSAAAIEKFLTCKETTPSSGPMAAANTSNKVKFDGNDLRPFLESLFPPLFAIVDNQEWNENEYVMKCIMRSLSTAREEIFQAADMVLQKMNEALFVVAKNPRNPQYNHFLFESIAILVKSVCSNHPENVTSFEELLFPPFQTVLQMDVSEFTPYVFQILAQLLEYRPANSGLGNSYTALFTPLLTPSLWDSKGNVPALTRLLQAYLLKGASDIVANNQLNPILGIFQKLLASKATEIGAFELLGAITLYVPMTALEPMIGQIFLLLFKRLQGGKTIRYVRLLTGYFAQFIGQFGSQKWFSLLDTIQPGLGNMIISQVWLPRLAQDEPVRIEVKTQVVGLTKIVCETPSLLNDTAGQQILMATLVALVQILSTKEAFFGTPTEDFDQTAEIGYDPTFSKLHFASRTVTDPFSEITNPVSAFANSLKQAQTTNPAWTQLLQQGSQSDPKFFVSLQGIMQKAGLHI